MDLIGTCCHCFVYRSKQVQVAWNQINGFVPKSGIAAIADICLMILGSLYSMKDLNDKASLSNQVPTH